MLHRQISSEPTIRVGIMQRPEISFRLFGSDRIHTLCRADVDSVGGLYRPTLTSPGPESQSSFELLDVSIGIGFHWERTEAQRFEGQLLFCSSDSDPDSIIAINEIGLEAYLRSVISSEMNADAPEEFLKAHAITSRSWLLRQLLDVGKHLQGRSELHSEVSVGSLNVPAITRWYDREDHTQFDVCADDHCQRYQGITRQTSPAVARAVHSTRGIVLTFNSEICDARFSKCCGGRTEIFSSCWEDSSHPYLQAIDDPFCRLATPEIIQTALNSYDRESPDHYEWTEHISADSLSALLFQNSGIDFGRILHLRAISRGESGRITGLLVKGTKRSAVVGKELEIRRWLSPSHLRSSWFDIEGPDTDGSFTLRGRGWGHGVGLCQIGAAVMGAQGHSSTDILHHYFPKASITRIYQ